MKEKLLEEFRRYVDHYDNMQGLLIVRIAEKDIESIIDQAYEAGRESAREENVNRGWFFEGGGLK